MKPREIAPDVHQLGVVDWDGRLFDAFVPLPEGTSYNCYLIRGRDKTALIDTVEADKADVLFAQLEGVERIDYVISLHAEQDHSGSIPLVLERFPDARLIASKKALNVLSQHLGISKDKLDRVGEGDTLDLGGKVLRFVDTPWVHWPETMSAYLEEDKILFSCDFFGAHLATSDLYADDERRVYAAAKFYYAHIMMPFAAEIMENLTKVDALDIDKVAPSHGPVHRIPEFIINAYKDWAGNPPRNRVLIPFVSMHGSVRTMVDRLVAGLVERGVGVDRFDLSVTDPGRLATALVDAGTVVFGASVVQDYPHPLAAMAAYSINLLKPKTRFVSFIGSYSWSRKALPILMDMMPNLSVETIEPILGKGAPTSDDFEAIDALAQAIADKHAAAGLV